jgi:hypothetical protein
MRLPRLVIALAYAGLLPFLTGPLWIMLGTPPAWLDHAWIAYVVLIAAFLAGTFWGFALPASEGPEGLLGLLIASLLMLLTWGAMILPFRESLLALSAVFFLLLLADFWRERTLGTVEGYFTLRTTLTVGVLLAIAWRWWLGVP